MFPGSGGPGGGEAESDVNPVGGVKVRVRVLGAARVDDGAVVTGVHSKAWWLPL